MAPAWTPSGAYLDRSRLRTFAMKNGCADYEALLRWSTEDLEGFWAATERDLRISWRTPYTHVLDMSRGLPWTTWWTGGGGASAAAGPPRPAAPPALRAPRAG